MELRKVKLADIKPYENNARKNDKAVDAVAESIRQCEYIAPIILDEDNVILAGHTRYKALKKLGYTEADCVVKAGLSDEQKRKYRLLDNKTAEFSEWDEERLAQELEGLDFEGFDFAFSAAEAEESLEEELDEQHEVEKKQKAEIPFSDYIDEESQYVVLKFRNKKDWLYASSVLGLEKVKSLSTRKDGRENKNFQFTGIGRVLDGVEAMEKIIANGEALR